MSDLKHGTDIEWTHWPHTKGRTWIPIVGCSIEGRPDCIQCYAMKLAGTRLKNHSAYAGTTIQTKAGPVWSGRVNTIEARVQQPLHWRAPSTIFLTSMGDVFHRKVPWMFIDKLMAVACSTPHHRYMILTKRTADMANYVAIRSLDPKPIHEAAADMGLDLCKLPAAFPQPNLWWGCSVGNQKFADHHLPILSRMNVPGRRWVSQEPGLGPIDYSPWLYPEPLCDDCPWEMADRSLLFKNFNKCCLRFYGQSKINWVVVGGESKQPGKTPRAFDCNWARSTIDQFKTARVPVFVKQLGASPVNVYPDGSRPIGLVHGALPEQDNHNGNWEWWPEDLKVRQFPTDQLPAEDG